MTNHPNRKPYVTIQDGQVRLYHDGRVKHYDGSISAWRNGWGVYATTSSVGEDWRTLTAWRRQTDLSRD